MALSRRTGARFQASIWPGFVDAMTGLLLVLMFVLTIFMIVQFVLTERITGQESELDQLAGEVAALAQALGLEEQTTQNLRNRVGALDASLSDAENRIAALTATRDAQAAALESARTQITGFEAQVAALISQRDSALGNVAALEQERADLQSAQAALMSEQEALNLALAAARDEVNAQEEVARLAAARREALDTLVADLRARNADAEAQIGQLSQDLDATAEALSEEEAARLAEAAAAEALRNRLEDAGAELTAMTLALEAQRKEAEDTLTLLAAARAAEADLDTELAAALLQLEGLQGQGEEISAELALVRLERDDLQIRLEATLGQLDETQSAAAEELAARRAAEAALADTRERSAEEQDALRARLAQALAAKLAAEAVAQDETTDAQRRAALLAEAQRALSEEEATSAAAQRQTELLNQQVAALRQQLGGLQALLDDAKERDSAQQVQLQSLGSDLNTALARVAAEERRRAELEAAERRRLEAEAARLAGQAEDLERYRSEFFGRLRDVLGRQEGVRIEGDRFVFSSEVLFEPARADLSPEGREDVAKVARIISGVASDIPSGIEWIIRVDGHTDNLPLSGQGEFADNWELSQARALSVVRYMVDNLGIPPQRLAANGFGEFQPVATGDSEEARAQNRRIELKFTER